MTCSAERQLRVANVNVGKKIAVATQATSTVTVTTGSDPNFGPQSVLNRSSAGREPGPAAFIARRTHTRKLS